MTSLWLLASILLSAATTTQAVYFCTPANEMCLNSTLTSNGTEMLFTVTTGVSGWVGIGLGSLKMKGADIYMLYTLNNNQVVSDRTGTGHTLPAIDPVQTARIVSNTQQVQLPTGHSIIYRFARPLQAAAPAYTLVDGTMTDMIWAVSNSPVTSANILREHSSEGSAAINFFSASGVQLANAIDLIVLWHGVLMSVAWALLVPAAIFIARYGKHRLGVWWFRLHYGLLSLAVLLTVVGAGVKISESGLDLFHNVHTIIGTFIIVGSVVQLILGVVIDKKFNPTRSEIPLRDKVHWWLGRVLFALSILNIFLGIAVANSGVIYWYFVYAAVVLITVGVFVWAQRSFGGQQHHQEKQLSDTIPMGGKFVNGHNNA